MSERVWCEHITFEKRGEGLVVPRKVGYYINGDIGLWVTPMTQFCAICGTPRPEPKKGLAEKLESKWNEDLKPIDKDTWDGLANCALEHFVAVVESECGGLEGRTLKKAMEDSLNG